MGGRSWEIVGGRGRSWEVVGGRGRSVGEVGEVNREVTQAPHRMALMLCFSLLSSPPLSQPSPHTW